MIESLQARIAAHADSARGKLASDRERNRAKYPDVAAWLDDIRAHFDVTWFRIHDNGKTVVEWRRG